MKKRVLAGLAALVLGLIMFASTAFAAPVVVYDEAGTVNWGQNGGVEGDLFVRLEEAEDFDMSLVDDIATIVVVVDCDTYFKPQYCVNTQSNNWDAKEVEHAEGGHFHDVIDVAGKFSSANTYNNFAIQSGWKNEGHAQITAIAFLDADGNVLYSVGDYDEAEEDVADEDAEEAEEEAVDEEAAEEETADESPKTGVASLALVFGAGALISGFAAFKKRDK